MPRADIRPTAPAAGAVFVWKRAAAVVSAIALTAGLVGCPRSQGDQPASNAPALDKGVASPLEEDAPTGRYGGTLTLAAYEPPRTFNPVLASDPASARCLAYVFDGLVEEDGQTYDVKPVLAETWRVSPDGRRYTFTLRPGLKWQDGKPITADDVVFTVMSVLRHPGIPWEAKHALSINGQLPVATQVDARTVRFELPAPFAPFLRAISGSGLPILPKHILGPWMAKDGDGKPTVLAKWGLKDAGAVVGSGPFKLVSGTPGQDVTLARNPLYFRVNRHQQPLPYLDKLVIHVAPGLPGAVAAFKEGRTDMQWLPAQQVADFKQRQAEGHFTLSDAGPDFRIAFLTFNLNPGRDLVSKPLVDPIKLAWFADARFRRAVSLTVDRDALIRDVYHGLAVPQNSPVFQKSPYYDPQAASGKLDRAQAQQLLTQAGFKRQGSQLVDAKGHPVRFKLLYELGATETLGQVQHLQKDLKAIGITLDAQGVPFRTKLDRTYRKRDWECQLSAWSAGIEPQGSAQLWTSHGLAHIFNLNPSAPRPYPWEKRIDTLFAQGVATLDEAKRKQIYGEFQRLVATEAPMVFLPVFRYTVAVRDSVGNAAPSAYSALGASWNVYELYKRP